jgi:two-component sensor histidine kinase
MDIPRQNTGVTRFPLVEPRAGETAAFVAIIRRLSIAQSLAEVMDIVTHAARSLLEADGVTFVLRDGDLCYYAEEDAISPLWKGRRFPMSVCISGWCMLHRQSAVIPNIYEDPRIPADAYRPTFVQSLIMVPVRQDDPIASIGAYWATQREVDSTAVELLQTIANAAALAIANVDLRSRKYPRTWMERASTRLKDRLDQALSGNTSKGNADQGRRSMLGVRVGSPAAYGLAFGSVAAAAAARAGLAHLFGPDVVPFATFFPAVLISTLAGGPSAGIAALAASALIGWWAFVPPLFSFQAKDISSAASLLLFCLSSAIIVWVADQFHRFTVALETNDRERRLIADELRHRVRNTLAVVQAVVRRTLGGDAARAETLNRRIAAIAATSDLLNEQSSEAVSLKSIAAAELKIHGEGRIVIEGVDVLLAKKPARTISLVFHELATNAAKYGAFSREQGTLSVRWTLIDDAIFVTWKERGGPVVAKPSREGFGMRFIERILMGVGGSVRTSWDSRGVVHEITLPLADR